MALGPAPGREYQVLFLVSALIAGAEVFFLLRERLPV
jgi:hypothetical protein